LNKSLIAISTSGIFESGWLDIMGGAMISEPISGRLARIGISVVRLLDSDD
jgi:hypothetical protein